MNEDKVTKSPEVNSGTPKARFMLMGLVLALMIFVLGWSSETQKVDKTLLLHDIIDSEDEDVEIVHHEPAPDLVPTPPLSPSTPAPLTTPERIEIIEDPVETIPDLDLEDTPVQIQEEVEVASPPAPQPAQPRQEEAEEIFIIVESQPEFPGGIGALMAFLNSNIKYPSIALENGIHGRVTCDFVVERDGSITDIKVVRGRDPALDREAVRVIGLMPKWSPGKQQGNPVRTRFTLPVVFRLQQ